MEKLLACTMTILKLEQLQKKIILQRTFLKVFFISLIVTPMDQPP